MKAAFFPRLALAVVSIGVGVPRATADILSYLFSSGNEWVCPNYKATGAPDLYFDFLNGSFSTSYHGTEQIMLFSLQVLPETEFYHGSALGFDGGAVLFNATGLPIGQDIGANSPGSWVRLRGLELTPSFFLGVKLNLDDGLHYGWIQLGYREQALGFFNGIVEAKNEIYTIQGMGWNDTPNLPIQAGEVAIPEPSEYAVGFGFAALLFALSRRFRSAGSLAAS